MNLDDLKDNLKSQLGQSWSRIEDSSFYNQMKDRFENLTPTNQKLAMMGAGALLALFVISIPYSYYSTSTEYVTTYEEKRSLIRELLKVTRESSEVPDLPPAPSADILRGNIENQLRMANLLPEQMKGIEVITAETSLIPKSLLESGLKVSLAKLNLRQIIDIGYNIQSVSTSVKMSSMSVTANAEDPKYFDVDFKLVSLAVPQAQVEMPEANDDEGGGGKGRKPFKRGNR
ncbi:hypothetical protein [Bdellovibrio sp. HCB337]|uniref:hypothetical protein n=1 Tax=Bdellovibrio sp. HCB337 TaxID=3394358 RepID=UPI0039A4227D